MNNHILILDDSQDILDALDQALSDEGYKVTTFNYCDDILKVVSEHQPDLVLLDYLLFGINGGELCHQIKTNPLTMHIPVVMMSGYPRVLESLGNYGSDAFIAKPFDLQVLFNTIKRCLPSQQAMSYC
jgi:DNA-binding response OmpR family regulator